MCCTCTIKQFTIDNGMFVQLPCLLIEYLMPLDNFVPRRLKCMLVSLRNRSGSYVCMVGSVTTTTNLHTPPPPTAPMNGRYIPPILDWPNRSCSEHDQYITKYFNICHSDQCGALTYNAGDISNSPINILDKTRHLSVTMWRLTWPYTVYTIK